VVTAGVVAEGSKLQSSNSSNADEMRDRCPYYPSPVAMSRRTSNGNDAKSVALMAFEDEIITSGYPSGGALMPAWIEIFVAAPGLLSMRTG